MNRSKRLSVRRILGACRCQEHPLIQQARREPTQQTCVRALFEFIQNARDSRPESQGLDSSVTVY